MKHPARWTSLLSCIALWLVSSASLAQKADRDIGGTKGKSAKEEHLTEEQEVSIGKQLYDASCKMCHRADGKGTLEEMDLTDNIWKHGNTPENVEKVIREGIKGTGMRAIMGEHTDQQIKALVKYVLKFSADASSKPVEPSAPPPEPPVPPSPPPTPPRPPAW